MKASLRWRLLVVLSAALAVIGLVAAGPASGAGPNERSPERDLSSAAEGRFEVLEAADQYAEARTSPAELVDAGAFTVPTRITRIWTSRRARGPRRPQSHMTATPVTTATRCGRTRAAEPSVWPGA